MDCLASVTRILSKLEEENTSFTCFDKNKERIANILCSPGKDFEEKLRMLEEVVTTQKEMMEELRRCEEEVGRYASSPRTAKDTVEALCLNKQDTEQRLNCVKPVAEVLWKWEVEIPNFFDSKEGRMKICEALCSSGKSIQWKLRMLEKMATSRKETMGELQKCWKTIEKYSYTSSEIVEALFIEKKDADERFQLFEIIGRSPVDARKNVSQLY